MSSVFLSLKVFKKQKQAAQLPERQTGEIILNIFGVTMYTKLISYMVLSTRKKTIKQPL